MHDSRIFQELHGGARRYTPNALTRGYQVHGRCTEVHAPRCTVAPVSVETVHLHLQPGFSESERAEERNTMTKPDDYETYRNLAEQWLDQSFHRQDIDAGRECLWTAQVYATLAQAAATADLADRGIEVYSQ
ncbi:hypothetical protein BH23ACT5_BH23ACT5_09910 [soil metagenome]